MIRAGRALRQAGGTSFIVNAIINQQIRVT
jgi:hypothetical protein